MANLLRQHALAATGPPRDEPPSWTPFLIADSTIMRRRRLELPGIPLHITQRGVNRGATFIDEDDHLAYFEALQIAAIAQDVAVHGWVLMGNHVHLLVSAEAAGAVSRMMQAIGRRYVRAFNAKYARTGTLWEGRFRSCLVDSERYLLTCLPALYRTQPCACRTGGAAVGLPLVQRACAPWPAALSAMAATPGLRGARRRRRSARGALPGTAAGTAG